MITITGSQSFIGKNLILDLEKKKKKIFKIDLNEKNSINSKKINFRNKNIKKYIKKNSTLVHLAAIANDNDGKKNPQLTFDVNINGTINLLEAAKEKQIKHFVFASTEWVYDKNQKKINKESDNISITKMTSEYSISKIICEQIIKKYSEFFKITILRFGIIYSNRLGGGSAVESLVHKVMNKQTINIGSLKTSRNFIHINDIISGINASIIAKKVGLFNLAGDKNVNLREIINTAGKILKTSPKVVETNKKKPSIRIVENKLAKKHLNWEPKINIIKGIKLILNKQ
jgi:nucleoside-diphosphate-sugar epimerase